MIASDNAVVAQRAIGDGYTSPRAVSLAPPSYGGLDSSRHGALLRPRVTGSQMPARALHQLALELRPPGSPIPCCVLNLMFEVGEATVSKRRLADRRSDVRFEFVGHLWGTLVTVESLPLRNIGRGGALVESRRRLLGAPVHNIHLIHDAGTTTIRAKVRHVTPIVSPSGVARYLIGLEFLDPEETALEQIDHLVAAAGGSRTPSTESTDVPAGAGERRRFPRATVASAHELRLPCQMTVQLLDISAGGVALAAPQPVEPAARAQLQARMGAYSMLVDLEVLWVAPDREPGKLERRYRLGARLVATDETKRSIQKILRDKSLH